MKNKTSIENPLGLSTIRHRLIQSGGDICTNEPEKITYQHTVFCQTGLPYRNPGNDVRSWERKQGRTTLRVNAGEVLNPETQDFIDVGLPFGPKPRLILAHLNSEALRTSSPVIEVEASLTAFVRRVGLSGGGRDVKGIKNHLTRLSASTIRLGFVENEHAVQINTQIVKAFDLWFTKKENQRVLWPTTIQLGEDYFTSLMSHAVPLDERAVAALSHSAMGLDIYAWLSQRLHRVSRGKSQFITWAAIKDQFGWRYGRMDNFKRVFRRTLTMVHTQYPNAKFDINNKGITLRNSPPPIASRKTLIGPFKR